MRIESRRVVALALAAFALAGGLLAQSKTTSALTGTVVDESGAAVPGATVEASSPSQIGGARSTTSDAQGRFRFAEIAPGIWAVSVSLDGFQPVRVEGVTLALESNMPADRYLELVSAAPLLGICFDTGNRTAAGLDIVSDIAHLARYVRVVHIKDRLLGGPNVPLGTGAAPLDAFLAALVDAAYSGPVILETTVGENYAAHARRNLDFVRSRLASRSQLHHGPGR